MFRRRFSILLLLLLASVQSACDLDSKLSQYGNYSRSIAKGYTADVVLFSRTLDNSTFAIKRFFGNAIQGYDGEYDDSIRAEYAISSALHHEHIISTYDLIYEDHFWHIVMDYCPAVLSSKIARARVATPILPREVNCVFKQLLEAVEYMHGQGIAHQDLKPNNIGLDHLGRVKLLDFGQSYRYQDQLSKQLTLQWAPRGGIPYVPLEVYQEMKYDPRPVDIFAIAIIFCEMIQPTLPWKRRALPGDNMDRFGLFAQDAVQRQFEKQGLGSDGINQFNNMAYEDEVEVVRATTESLSKLLPEESRKIIIKMLEPIPSQRARFIDIFSDLWVKQISCPNSNEDLEQVD